MFIIFFPQRPNYTNDDEAAAGKSTSTLMHNVSYTPKKYRGVAKNNWLSAISESDVLLKSWLVDTKKNVVFTLKDIQFSHMWNMKLVWMSECFGDSLTFHQSLSGHLARVSS